MDDFLEPRPDVQVPVVPGLIDQVELQLMERFQGQHQAKGEQVYPLTHRFTPGLYIREIVMPTGAFLTTRIHKTEHPFFIQAGICQVYLEGQGWELIKAPYSGVTVPGTRRILYILEETTWITVHLNPKEIRDIKELEKMLMVDYTNPLIKDLVNKELSEGGEL